MKITTNHKYTYSHDPSGDSLCNSTSNDPQLWRNFKYEQCGKYQTIQERNRNKLIHKVRVYHIELICKESSQSVPFPSDKHNVIVMLN